MDGDERAPAAGNGDFQAAVSAVGNIAKLLGPQLSEIVHHCLLEQIGMYPRDAVDAIRG